MLCILFFESFLCSILSKMYTETAEISKKEDCEFLYVGHVQNYELQNNCLNACSEGNILFFRQVLCLLSMQDAFIKVMLYGQMS